MEQNYWENRFLNNDHPWDIGEISRPLKEYIDQLDDKSTRILIPGCGFGHEAKYLFEQGFKNTFVLDFSETAIEQFKQNCPELPTRKIIQGDFFLHEGTYNLILEQTFFCAINPSKREEYFKQISKLLSPKGKLVGLFFDCEFENNPPFGGSKKEYENLITKHFQNFSLEPCYNSIQPRQGRELFVKLQR